MNVALFRKTAYEQRWLLGFTLVAGMVLPVFFVHAFVSFPVEQTKEFLTNVPFVKAVIKALSGADIADIFELSTMGAFAFVHPGLLALGWACIVVGSARVIAGEIENGTADLLLALPVSRLRTYVTVTTWVLVCCPLFTLVIWCGIWIGSLTAGMSGSMDVWRLRFVVVNHTAMLIAVAGVSTMISAVNSRRGHAMGVAFGILLCSFVLNSLAAFWESARQLAYVGLLHYFRPYAILGNDHLATGDIAVLLAVALVTWSIGAFIFTRRDIHTS